MSTFIRTKAALTAQLRDLVAGTLKHPSSGSLTLDGSSFTSQALAQAIQSLADALAKVDAAKADWKDALQQANDVQAKILPVVGAYRSWLVATYGSAPSTLADYGIAPPKARTPQTVEQLAAAAAKRNATRAARHTLGKKQKKAIKGVVPATTPAVGGANAPATAPSTATAVTVPASAAPAASSVATPAPKPIG